MDISVSNTAIPPPQADGWHVQQLVAVLRRYQWLIGVLALAGAVAAYGFARTVPKSFTATTQIAVEGERLAIPELRGVLRDDSPGDPMPWVRTEALAFTSRDLVGNVAEQLDLKSRPEFNPLLREPSLTDKVKGFVQSLLPHGPVSTDGPIPLNEIVLGEAQRALSVFNDGRSLVIQISFTSHDPTLAANFANAMATAYIASRGNRRTSANQDANKALTDRVDVARNDLADIERQIRDFRSKSDLLGVRAGSIGQQQAEELATAVARASVETGTLQTQYDRAATLSKSGSSDALASVLNSPTISSMRQQESVAQQKVADLSTRYGPGYPGVRSASAELASAQRGVREETQRIIASLSTQLGASKAHLADLHHQLDEARKAGVVAENANAQLTQLQQEAMTRRALYQTLLESAQKTVAQPSASATTDVRVVSMAAAPLFPSSPNMKVAAGAGGIGGGLLGCLVALTRLRSPRRMRGASDIAATLGLPVTAVLKRNQVGRGRAGIAARVVAAPGGPEAEVLRGLRVQVSHLGRVTMPRSVMFTGTAEEGGAPAIAAALARVAAMDGERVLLIEGNLQRPLTSTLLGQRADGLRAVLGGGQDWRDELQRDGSVALDVLALTEPAANPHGLLGSNQFTNLLADAQGEYDLVVLTAPAIGASDAMALAGRADVTAVVLDGGMGQREAVLQAINGLDRMSRNPLAFVLVAS